VRISISTTIRSPYALLYFIILEELKLITFRAFAWLSLVISFYAVMVRRMPRITATSWNFEKRNVNTDCGNLQDMTCGGEEELK
jgi:hypothetical protein